MSALFAHNNLNGLAANTWIEADTATNDTATATRDGEAGKNHYVTSVSASFVAAASAEKTLVLKFDGVMAATWGVKDGRDLRFSPALQVPQGEDVSVELAAGGSSVVGHVVLTGFTT